MRISFTSHLLAFSLLALTVLSAPSPRLPKKQHPGHHKGDSQTSGSIKDLPGHSDSKRKPPLISGNIVITSDPNVILDSAKPTTPNPLNLEERLRQKNDTLRGFVTHAFDAGQYVIKTTIQVLDVPETARGKWCSFHFIFGVGDSMAVSEIYQLWSLDGPDNKKPEFLEFQATWENRPYRNYLVAEFHTGAGEVVSKSRGDGKDAKFRYFHSKLIDLEDLEYISENGSPPIASFLCDPFVGKQAWEVVAVPRFDQKTGVGRVDGSAWSMNKGLMLEIHGIPPLVTDIGQDL